MLLLGAMLHSWDWLVIGAYIALIVGAGVWAQWRTTQKSATDYFLAGRRIPVWAVAVSTLATAQSAATFVGVPQDSYDGNLTYLSASIGAIVASVVLAWVFIPAYYRLGVATPYQLLETRFGPGARTATGLAYLVGRVFASGARVYVGAIPVAVAMSADDPKADLSVTIAMVIGVFMVFSILYTLWGGLESVIWTDVVQVCVYLGAAVVVLVLLARSIPASTGEILAALGDGGSDGTSKLKVLDVGIDTTRTGWINLGTPFTLVTALTGWVLLNLAAFGTDQDLTQRLLTCKSAAEGSRSVIASTLLGIPVVCIFAAVGLLLWVFFNRPDLMGRPTPAYVQGDTARVFLKYALHELPAGAAGLVIAGVLAAGPAGVNASLNTMAGTVVNDFYKPRVAPGKSDGHYVKAGRWAVVGWGLVLWAFAVACIWWQRESGENIINFVLGVMGFAYAGMLAVFVTALFTKRGTTWSVILAMAVGFAVVLALQPTVWAAWTSWTEWTKTNLSGIMIAGPWRLVFGTLIALPVCMLPRGRGERA